jgi:hypothetical protein
MNSSQAFSQGVSLLVGWPRPVYARAGGGTSRPAGAGQAARSARERGVMLRAQPDDFGGQESG